MIIFAGGWSACSNHSVRRTCSGPSFSLWTCETSAWKIRRIVYSVTTTILIAFIIIISKFLCDDALPCSVTTFSSRQNRRSIEAIKATTMAKALSYVERGNQMIITQLLISFTSSSAIKERFFALCWLRCRFRVSYMVLQAQLEKPQFLSASLAPKSTYS